MGKAARIKRQKAEADRPKHQPAVPGERTSEIRLANPVSEHFATFIIANGLVWEALAHDELLRVAPEAAASLEPFEGVLGFLARNGRPDEERGKQYDTWMRFRDLVETHCTERFVAQQNSAQGQHIVICGAGPTLAHHAAEWCPQADQVWGVNSALPYLQKHGHRVTHGLTVDQTAHMCAEWFGAPDVEYLLASTVHPHLTEYLRKRDRRMRFFHNFVGIRQRPVRGRRPDGKDVLVDYETWLYSMLYHSTVRCGSGLNSVTRAIDLALFMGARQVTVLGADCCLEATPLPAHVVRGSPEHIDWLRTTKLHADGGDALASEATPLTLQGRAGGREWVTKPDMVISAVWLVKMQRHLAGRLTLIGDTLPNALAREPEDFLDRMPVLTGRDGKPIPITLDQPLDPLAAPLAAA